MPETDSEPTLDEENPYDVFEVGDELPWKTTTATVTAVENGVEEYPDPEENEDVLEYGAPPEFSGAGERWPLTLVTFEIERDGETSEGTASAEWVYREVGVRFDEHGLPSVRAYSSPFSGGNGASVQTPATGDNHLPPEEAERLAEFLRDHADFEPLYALLGRTDSPEDMNALADALEMVKDAHEVRDRKD